MNNSFARLVDGMNATLRNEVLPRLDDDFARGQVFGVINLLNTFKVRADWSAGFLLQQIEAQRAALRAAEALARTAAVSVELPASPPTAASTAPGSDSLLRQRDDANRSIAEWLRWLDSPTTGLLGETHDAIVAALRAAMRAEVEIELRHSPRPLFAEMSSGKDG